MNLSQVQVHIDLTHRFESFCSRCLKAWHNVGNSWEVLKNCLGAWQPYLVSLGADVLVHFYWLSHRELDVHSENAFIPLLNSSNILNYENHF